MTPTERLTRYGRGQRPVWNVAGYRHTSLSTGHEAVVAARPRKRKIRPVGTSEGRLNVELDIGNPVVAGDGIADTKAGLSRAQDGAGVREAVIDQFGPLGILAKDVEGRVR